MQAEHTTMNTGDAQTWVIAVLVLIGLIAIAWILTRERHSRHLQERFGPEYRRVVAERGDRTKAEAELRAREKRVERFKIVPLAPADAARFGGEWDGLQARFVDDPKAVVAEADRLVRDLMATRGYPMSDFERQAADLSVDHPAVVENYRAANAIVVLNERGDASTEQLRKAVVYYRDLFDELFETRHTKPAAATHERKSQVQS
jgi:hypothetical protein